MRASELIAILAAAIAKHGDLPIYICGFNEQYNPGPFDIKRVQYADPVHYSSKPADVPPHFTVI